MAWSDDAGELKQLKNDCGSALALMECKPRHNTTDVATLYWAGMPGNAGDFPSEESFYTLSLRCVFLQKKPITTIRHRLSGLKWLTD